MQVPSMASDLGLNLHFMGWVVCVPLLRRIGAIEGRAIVLIQLEALS